MTAALVVDGISKKYALGAAGRPDTVREVAARAARRIPTLLKPTAAKEVPEPFWALRDVSFQVEPGQVVGGGSGALFRIAAGGEMELRAQLSQADLASVRVGIPVQVTPVGSASTVNGRVWQVAPVIDPQTRLGEARISVPYTPVMRPGGFAEAKITAGAATLPRVPQSAVQADERGNYVYMIDNNNMVVRRDVQIGSVSSEGVSIVQGLSGQERVVLSAAPFLNPGQKVAPRRATAS